MYTLSRNLILLGHNRRHTDGCLAHVGNGSLLTFLDHFTLTPELGTCGSVVLSSYLCFLNTHYGLKEGFNIVLLAWRQVNLTIKLF